MKPMRYRKDQLVEVQFLDHAEDSDEPMLFTVWGKIQKVARRHIVIDAWAGADDDNVNRKSWSIIRSAIQSSRELTYLEPNQEPKP